LEEEGKGNKDVEEEGEGRSGFRIESRKEKNKKGECEKH